MKPLPNMSASSVKERLSPEPLKIFLQAATSVAHAPVKSMASARNPSVSDPTRMTTRMATERKFNAGFRILRSAIYMRQHALNRSGETKTGRTLQKYTGTGSCAMAGLRLARKRESLRPCPRVTFSPHGRACPGRPRLSKRSKDVDARHKAGHDEFQLRARFHSLHFKSGSESQPKGTSRFQTR